MFFFQFLCSLFCYSLISFVFLYSLISLVLSYSYIPIPSFRDSCGLIPIFLFPYSFLHFLIPIFFHIPLFFILIFFWFPLSSPFLSYSPFLSIFSHIPPFFSPPSRIYITHLPPSLSLPLTPPSFFFSFFPSFSHFFSFLFKSFQEKHRLRYLKYRENTVVWEKDGACVVCVSPNVEVFLKEISLWSGK